MNAPVTTQGPVARFLALDPPARIVEIDEQVITIEPDDVDYDSDRPGRPSAECTCGEPVAVWTEESPGNWCYHYCQGAIVRILTDAADPICDLAGEQGKRIVARPICPDCLAEAHELKIKSDLAALRRALLEAETLAREIELTDGNRPALARTRQALAELVDLHAPSVGGAA